MKMFKVVHITILFLLSSNFTLGQFNLQTGYDYGLIQLEKITSLTTDDEINWNSLQRFNFNVEYISSSKLLFSLDIGIDTYSEKMKSVNIQKNIVEKRRYDGKIITLRNQLSIGYLFEINKENSLVFKISSGIFSIRDIKIFESSFEKKVFEDDTHTDPPIHYSIEHKDKTDFQEVYGYKSKYLSGFNLLQTSIEYRYTFNDWSCNLFLGYTPMQKQIIQRFNNNNLFLLGIRIGYYLPSKTNNNEK